MRHRKLYYFIFLLAITGASFGQQEPQFSQYMYTILPTNPGYAGNAGICASLHYRQQWAGFADVNPFTLETHKTAPRTMLVSIHSPVKALRGGLGLSIYSDAIGHQSDIGVKLAYAYKTNISGGNLGIGLSGDFLSRKINKSMYYGSTSTGGQSAEDEILNSLGEDDMHIDVSFGAFYQMQDRWYAGVSGTQLISAIGGDKDLQKGKRHFYFLGGYKYELPANPDWSLKPSALIKTDLSMVQFDLTLVASYTDLVWFGASYRMIDAVAILVGAKPFINFQGAIKGLEIIGTYDITTSKMLNRGASFKGRSLGGYEFCIKYCFNIVTIPPIYGYKNTKLLGNRPIDYR